jgi:hypothetical protein
MLCKSIFTAAIVVATLGTAAAEPLKSESRRPANDAELRRWLENMVWHHRFSTSEITDATGLSEEEIAAALKRLNIDRDARPARGKDAPLLVLPYPGGRHPRIGFLDGAIRPQRETKVSVFTPWDAAAYIVLDIPEAIWWKEGKQRELLYLAHTHIPTTWSKQGIELEQLEWNVSDEGELLMERKLPNGIEFGTRVVPAKNAVRLEMWLKNGTGERLTGLSVQNCVMFKGAPEFAAVNNDNKIFAKPYVACQSKVDSRWVITAWTSCERVWGNPPCPCMHSDPKFADCEPGATSRLRGWVSFYEGTDIEAEFKRIDAMGWQRQDD